MTAILSVAGSVHKSSCVVDSEYDARHKHDLPDAKFLRKLQKQIKDAFSERSNSGVVTLTEAFTRLDKNITEENFSANIWQFKTFLKDATGLNDRQLELLFEECLTLTGQVESHTNVATSPISAKNGENQELPAVDLAEVMVFFRKMFGCQMQQFHDILKKLRGKKLDIAQSPFARDIDYEPSRLEIYDYLTQVGLTQSEAFLFMEHCTVLPQELAEQLDDLRARTGGSPAPIEAACCDGEIDTDYIINCLYAFPMPDDIAYPILVGKFVEAACDVSGTKRGPYNGSVGIADALARYTHKAAQNSTTVFTPQQQQQGAVNELNKAGVPVAASTTGSTSEIANSSATPARSTTRRRLLGGGGGSAVSPPPAGHQNPNAAMMTPKPSTAAGSSPVPQQAAGGFSSPVPSEAEIAQDIVSDACDLEEFRAFTADFGAGLPRQEVDLLFKYLAKPGGMDGADVVSRQRIIGLFRSRLPLLPKPELMHLVTEIRHILVERNFDGICTLHANLTDAQERAERDPVRRGVPAVWRGGRSPPGTPSPPPVSIPLPLYTAAFRNSGVPVGAISNVDLEHLHREAPTCVEVILLLRGTLSPQRESILNKLFTRLDDDKDGLVDRSVVLDFFRPELADPRIATNAFERKQSLQRYLQSLPREEYKMSFAEFAYYWGNVSASFPDDPTFVMLLWQSYGMQRDTNTLAAHATMSSPSMANRRAMLPSSSPKPSPPRSSLPPTLLPMPAGEPKVSRRRRFANKD